MNDAWSWWRGHSGRDEGGYEGLQELTLKYFSFIFLQHMKQFSSSLPSPFCWSGRLHHEHFLRLDNLTAGYFIQTFSFLMIWGTVLIILDKPSWEAASLNSWMVMIDHQIDFDHQNAALRWSRLPIVCKCGELMVMMPRVMVEIKIDGNVD